MEQNAANELIKLYSKQLRLPSFNKFSKVIQQLEPSESYADFLMKFDLTVGKEKSANALCKRVEQNNIPVNSPQHLERYDNLLRREVI